MEKIITNPLNIAAELAAVAKALLKKTKQTAPDGLSELLNSVKPNTTHEAIAEQLNQGANSSVLLGPQAINHPQFSTLRGLANAIAQLSNSHMGYLPEAGNTSGAWLAGVLPHRTEGGAAASAGLNALEMFTNPLKAYVIVDLEPDVDSANPHAAMNAMMDAEFVVVLTPFNSSRYQQYADVLLPIAPFTETAGTFINAEGVWQSFTGVVPSLGEARPAWKVLRVLGNLFQCEGFNYASSEEVLNELREKIAAVKADNTMKWRCPDNISTADKVVRIAEMQTYAWDSLQRRAQALQSTPDAYPAAIRINEKLAKRLGLADGDRATATQNGAKAVLPVVIDNTVADESALIHAGLVDSAALSANLDEIEISRL
jgi:NADH-quinone oxidoreductase subunit G